MFHAALRIDLLPLGASAQVDALAAGLYLRYTAGDASYRAHNQHMNALACDFGERKAMQWLCGHGDLSFRRGDEYSSGSLFMPGGKSHRLLPKIEYQSEGVAHCMHCISSTFGIHW